MFISTALIPGIMFGVEIPDTEEGEFIMIVDLFVIRVIFEKYSLN